MEEPQTDPTKTDTSKATKDILSSLLPSDVSLELADKTEVKIDWESENARLDFDNRLQKKKRRERWDTTLASLVVLGFGLSYLLIILIGGGLLSFDNMFAVPSVVAAGVLETYGLAKLAIKYFFNDDDMRK